MRLNKYIATCGICSRRSAENYIICGKVKVNGKVVTNLSTKVDELNDKVEVLGKNISIEKKKVYIMLNKPKGFVTTNKEQFNRKCTLDLIKEPQRVFPIGRLDMYTEGLLLFTNDGDFANKITHPKNKIEKVYVVKVDKNITKDMIYKLENGLDIGGYITKEAKVNLLKEREFEITISEGKNRQVRKMCEAVGLKVLELKGIKLGNIKLGDLQIGKYRFLTKNEIESIKKA